MKWYKKDQHFLTDEQVLGRIIEYGRLNHSDTVLEIGAGYGNLTEKLAQKAGKVIAIEVDPELASSFNRLENVELIIGDALEQDFPHFNKVISNLPYSISSQVTFKLLEYEFDMGILMYQHEFAQRMVAEPGGKDYGRLSIAVQYRANIEILEIVPRLAFHIPPKVDSAIIRLVPRLPPYEVKDVNFFMKFITAAFSQRRKKLKNAILNNTAYLGIKDKALEKLPPDIIDRRAETISPEELAGLSDLLFDDIFKYH
ncbi:MAG: 16S rRNA (adenine(1518)-N(6)/adenine(1519)-N(6))-dimethyltransferase RsmA [Candidatus Methanoperedens sp.]|nr:16S rRNA (adenine(1518)-N(6)/adenine(1519)-N(6))-dimethyltransferase RsmA [Candidatus Methanoperedens sp.]